VENGPDLVRIGTRGSRLARWQAEWVAARLHEQYPELSVEIVEIKTQGDRDRNSPLSQIGGQGLFTKEIQRALAESQVDVAVHSLKDLPTTGPEGLVLAAVPAREDVADALIAPRYRTLEALPPGAPVGTGSLRRRAQLLYRRPDLKVVPIRGNVETRLQQALEGPLEAVVLATAGLFRLGLGHHVTQRLGPPDFLPAVGQGALGVECRSDDPITRSFVESLDDPTTHATIRAERSLLAELEGGCMVPLSAWARRDSAGLELEATLFDPDGRERVAASRRGPIDGPEALGLQIARDLRDRGADRILQRLRSP
jgi:hydroxymethylbilane synthase